MMMTDATAMKYSTVRTAKMAPKGKQQPKANTEIPKNSDITLLNNNARHVQDHAPCEKSFIIPERSMCRCW